MAKKEAFEHPKTFLLASELKIDQSHAFGILCSLWHFTSCYAKDGAIGRFSDHTICVAIKTRISPKKLMPALLKCGWLDDVSGDDSNARLVVHDWSHHCEKWVREAMKDQGIEFWDGAPTDRPPGRPHRKQAPESEQPPLPETPIKTHIKTPIKTPIETELNTPKNSPLIVVKTLARGLSLPSLTPEERERVVNTSCSGDIETSENAPLEPPAVDDPLGGSLSLETATWVNAPPSPPAALQVPGGEQKNGKPRGRAREPVTDYPTEDQVKAKLDLMRRQAAGEA